MDETFFFEQLFVCHQCSKIRQAQALIPGTPCNMLRTVSGARVEVSSSVPVPIRGEFRCGREERFNFCKCLYIKFPVLYVPTRPTLRNILPARRDSHSEYSTGRKRNLGRFHTPRRIPNDLGGACRMPAVAGGAHCQDSCLLL